jgi:hypothetical protein
MVLQIVELTPYSSADGKHKLKFAWNIEGIEWVLGAYQDVSGLTPENPVPLVKLARITVWKNYDMVQQIKFYDSENELLHSYSTGRDPGTNKTEYLRPDGARLVGFDAPYNAALRVTDFEPIFL